MRIYRLLTALLCLFLIACASTPHAPTPETLAALAPTGKLRVALYTGNPLQVIREPASQEMKGVGFDLGKELARRMGVSFEPVIYPSVGAVLGAIASSDWDIAVLVVSAARNEVDFTTALVEIELGYLVPQGSRLTSAAAVDQAGIRIAAPAKGQGEVILRRTLKQATVVGAPGLAALLDLLKTGKADAAAANKPILFELSAQLPGSRILDGRFSAERAAFALPKGREAGLAYVNKFIEDAKAQGLVKTALDRAGARSALVAAGQSTDAPR
jgi:polar amino acid transport system substrate-binding protein